jgi:hypothetical protein
MERRFFLKLLAASIAATNLYRSPQLHAQTAGTYNLALSLRLSLSGSGRIGFYIDYSELDEIGTHTFYLTRTHGSEGAIGCTWTAYDSENGTQLATGVLDWSDGSLDILSLNVNVTSKPNGDHRIYVSLTNPRGGAVLHHGDNTIAYGIIDDDTIATSNAIFIDADAASDGTGTQTSPYNNWYSARKAVLTTTRFIYIKGLIIPDETDSESTANADNYFGVLSSFDGRASESQRLVIRNWCGFVGGIDGNGQTNCSGFLCDGNRSDTNTIKYLTFRKLHVRNLNNADGGTSYGRSYFLRTRSYGEGVVGNITAEYIDIDGVLSGANSATAVWYSEDCSNLKMWRWKVANTSHLDRDIELEVFNCYRTDNLSIQRCTIESTAGGIFEKEGFVNETKVGVSLRFNHFKGGRIRISTQGNRFIQDFHIIQNNIFDEVNRSFEYQPIEFFMVDNGSVATKQHISNNIFYKYDFSSYADVAVTSGNYIGIIMYNNIHYESKRPWRLHTTADIPEYIDYNHYEYNANTDPVFKYLTSPADVSLDSVVVNTPFSGSATSGDPELNSASWRLAITSPCYQTGVDGSNKGVYLLGIEEIGAENLSRFALPSKMDQPEITIQGTAS